MFRKFIICVSILSMVFSFQQTTFAAALPAQVKVALSGRVGADGVMTIGNRSVTVGYEQGGAFSGTDTIGSAVGLTLAPDNAYYVALNMTYNDYTQAAAAANNLTTAGQKAVAAFVGNGLWQVYAGGFVAQGDTANALNAYGGTLISPNQRRMVLKDGQTAVAVFDNTNGFVQMADGAGQLMTLGNRSYRGRVQMNRTSTGLVPVNIVPTEEYLYGVVPSEMPSSWPLEALKAQSVAARCYTATRAGVHQDAGYDLCDTVHCQMYLGFSNESPSAIKAVKETAGVLAYYNGKPINATYFSSSGGMTVNSEEVWANAEPYLRGVPEVAEKEAKVWTRTFTLAEITALLQANGANIGQAQSLSIQTGAGGRVTEMTIVASGGSKTYTKDSIRTFFSQSSEGSLSSTMFTLGNGGAAPANNQVAVQGGNGSTATYPINTLYVQGQNSEPLQLDIAVVQALGKEQSQAYGGTATQSTSSSGNTIVLNGKGWGHGVGMSQYGAKGMAEAGYTYDQILKHYYTGIEVY